MESFEVTRAHDKFNVEKKQPALNHMTLHRDLSAV
jgi:hypothetical protein